MAIADASGLPVAAHVESASPHEVTLVEATVERSFVVETPVRLIGDKAYDSDGLDNYLKEQRGIEMVAPYRGKRKRPRTQDGRKLRRYKRRWKVERLFCLATEFQANSGSIRISCRELSRYGSTWMYRHPITLFLR